MSIIHSSPFVLLIHLVYLIVIIIICLQIPASWRNKGVPHVKGQRVPTDHVF